MSTPCPSFLLSQKLGDRPVGDTRRPPCPLCVPCLRRAGVAPHDLQLRITFRQTIRNWQVIMNVKLSMALVFRIRTSTTQSRFGLW
jgi:hypothetical protein